MCKIFVFAVFKEHILQISLVSYTSCNLTFQILERNAEAELERLTRTSKQMVEQLQANHAVDLKALEKRLKTDQVTFLFCCFSFCSV